MHIKELEHIINRLGFEKLFTRTRLRESSRIVYNRETLDLLDDIHMVLASDDLKDILLASIELVRGYLGRPNEHLLLSVFFSIWALKKALSNKIIFSRYLGFSPSLEIIFEGLISVYDKYKNTVCLFLSEFIGDLSDIVLTNELVSSPGFLGLLYLSEVCNKNVNVYEFI